MNFIKKKEFEVLQKLINYEYDLIDNFKNYGETIENIDPNEEESLE